jgi:hypothetical protein
MNITVEKLIKAMSREGYPLFENSEKPFNLNIIGVRSNDMTPNTFNDAICVLWKWKEGWNLYSAPATTDPGLYWLQNPMNVDGTFIIAKGHHKGLWKLGKHRGYPAFQQKGIVKGYRDADRDGEFDMDPSKLVEGIFGINGHRAKDEGHSINVGKWSAGCQVWQYDDDHEMIIELAKKAVEHWGNSFSYTLLLESDLGS